VRDWRAFVRERLPATGLTPEREARVVRELASQLEDFYREAVARGASDEDADRHAVAQIADWRTMASDVRRADPAHARPRVDRLVDAVEARPMARATGGLMLAHLVRDGRYALRQLVRAPGFSAVAVITIALGIAATTAIFSVVNGVLLRPLPYADPGALVRVHEVIPHYGRFSVAPANFLDWRQQNTVFETTGAYSSDSVTMTFEDGPEREQGAAVSWDLFRTLRATPAFGTAFTADQDKPGASPTIVLSHALWRDRFDGDRAIVGRVIDVNGAPTTVIGVMPPDFYFPSRAVKYWRPLAISPANATRGGHFLAVIGRLRDGVSVDQAAVAMRGLAERLARQYPNDSEGESAEVVRLQDQIVGAVRPALLTLVAAVGFLVLIACANVANLLLVRGSTRDKEIAIRTALGAGRRRLVTQMMAESVVLAVGGGVLGVALGYLAIPAIQQLGANSIPRVADVTLDVRVLVVAAAASILTGLLFGLAPAWQAARAGVSAALKDSSRGSSTSGGRWVRSTLLVVEVALSIVLLTGAVLLMRSFDRLTRVNPGFSTDGVLAFQLSLPKKSYADDARIIGFFNDLVPRLEAQPGVASAGLVQTLPLRGDYVLTFEVRGRAPVSPSQQPSAAYRVVSAHYFQSLAVPLVKGRVFTPQDQPKSGLVAVVDQAFAQKHFPGADAIGQGIRIGNGVEGYYEVIGVVGDVRYDGLDATPSPTMYVPFTQDPFSTMWVVMRTSGQTATLAAPARQVVRGLDPTLPIYSLNPLATIASESIASQRFSMLLLALFAGTALFLSAVGLYGVVAYSVTQRTREIGLRVAIGAEPGDVLRLVVGGGLKLALAGVVIGLGGALALSTFVKSLLFDVVPSDPTSYAVTAGVLLVVAAIACYIPARRATRVDPMVALQAE